MKHLTQKTLFLLLFIVVPLFVLVIPAANADIRYCYPTIYSSAAKSKADNVTEQSLIYPSFYFGTTKNKNHHIAFRLYENNQPSGKACYVKAKRGELSEYYSPFQILITSDYINPDFFNRNAKNDVLHTKGNELLNEIGELHFSEDYGFKLECSVDDYTGNDYFCGITKAVYDIYEPKKAPVVIGIVHRTSS